ncbi:MAG TPA: 23S rRNA (pseudouridine(1915)-N(3))-methyltransferase RlmH [Candidatus Acidoferrales bacterium]|nr:23S rRNA (pseudouridine(1915)-N(3))-methyltransferase RlmH [Candidatus Acidoferrales bacterium]
MHLRLIAVGRLREPYMIAAADDFRARLRSYHRIEEIEVRSDDAILKHVKAADEVWLLDRTGKQLSSEGLAQKLDAMQTHGRSSLTLIVGGADGVPQDVLARADFSWSLSELTFLHEWARIIVLEQLYRAAKIARNEPYHH